jgi:hypothetical protein
VVNGTLYPWCIGYDCKRFGHHKATDGKVWGSTTTAMTGYNSNSSRLNSYMQFDLGSARTDIGQVRLVAPMYQTAAVLPSNLSVYVSADKNFRAGVLCASDVGFAKWLESLVLLCPITSTRYVTVVDEVPNRRLALQEVAALYDGRLPRGVLESSMSKCIPRRCSWRDMCHTPCLHLPDEHTLKQLPPSLRPPTMAMCALCVLHGCSEPMPTAASG